MSKLLYANFARLMKNKIFWLIEIFLVCYGIFVYIMGQGNVAVFGVADNEWTIYFFQVALFIHALMAIFVPFYISTDYSDGTIRNKIIIGYERKDIYLANFVICYVVGVIYFLTYIITSLLAGYFLIGSRTFTGMTNLPWRIGYSLIIILVYSAVFSVVAMVDSNKARVAVVELLLVFVSVVLLTQIFGDLSQPERTNQVVMRADGTMEVEENVPNPKYVSGAQRVVYEWIDTLLPTDQAMYVLEPNASYSVKAPICMLGETILIVAAGLYIFERKDIK